MNSRLGFGSGLQGAESSISQQRESKGLERCDLFRGILVRVLVKVSDSL